MSADTVTVLLRCVLAATAFAGSVSVMVLYRRSRDPNPIPWLFFASSLGLYSVALFSFIVGSRLTVADWWRPTFSMLNLSLVVGSLWVLRRAVRHAW